MTRVSWGVRSLPGQMALIVAIALFVAQAINFGLMLHERREFRLEGVTAPAIARLIDSTDQRQDAGHWPRGRVRVVPNDPIDPALPRREDVAAAMRRGLGDVGFKFGRIDTGIRPIRPDDPRFRHMDRFRAERMLRIGNEVVIAIEQPGRGWLVLTSMWQRMDAGLIWRLVAQTLVLYGVILVPVLWIGRRISRPLRTLAEAARGFTPGGDAAPLEESGPFDVRAVIGAYNALRLRVTAMLGEKDRMLGAIGHDLRTPLAALRVRVESVEDEVDHDRMVEIIEEMNRTLDDILSLARIGQPSEPPIDVDLSALVDAVVEDFRDLGHDVAFEETPRLAMRLRPTLMRRAVRNLIENAIKYGGSARVTLTAQASAATIAVNDNGPGIPATRLVDVFDPFTRLETSRNKDTGGIGLGLALARAIVLDARGDLRLENRSEGGLAATIVLPR